MAPKDVTDARIHLSFYQYILLHVPVLFLGAILGVVAWGAVRVNTIHKSLGLQQPLAVDQTPTARVNVASVYALPESVLPVSAVGGSMTVEVRGVPTVSVWNLQ
jgi:hypothetical protein